MDIVLIIFQALILLALGSIYQFYLKKKLENQATKEDISEITTKIEEVKSLYASELEELKSSLQLANQIHTGAFDKRLEKYQQAFTLWLRLLGDLNTKELDNSVSACQIWWDENCLYLDKESRGSFKSAYLLASQLKSIKGAASNKYFAGILKTGSVITKALNLPPLTKEELEKPGTGQQSAT